MVMGLAGEVAVMRDRLDTLERLLERSGGLQRADIEHYRPDAQVVAERAAWREAFLGEVLRIVEIEVEALASGDQARYDTAIELVERDEAARAPAKPPAAARPSAGQGTARPATGKTRAAKAAAASAAAKAPARAKARKPAAPASDSVKRPPRRR
jgi:hypothetical protein